MPGSAIVACVLGFAAASPSFGPIGLLRIETPTLAPEFMAYAPREGDLVFFDDRHPVWTALFAYAGSGPPLHMGIVVKRSGGNLVVLEAGPDDTVKIELLDIEKRLPQFHKDFKGGITIRRNKKPVAEAESRAMTKFAEAQSGKRYAVGRLLLQGTTLRPRVLEKVFGGTSLERDSWICSELSVAAGTVAKLFDPKVVHSNVAYPRDLADNQRYNLSATWHDAAVWLPVRSNHR